MSYPRPFVTVFSGLLLACVAVSASAADRAGQVTRSQPDAYQGSGFFPDSLDTGDVILQQETVSTRDYGSLDIAFDDGSALTVGPNSQLVIDEFVFSPNTSTGAAAISLGKGVLRMISGRLPSGSVQIRTPVATIGIRGTDFVLDTTDEGAVKIWVDSGIVSAAPNQSSEVFEFEAPAFAVCTGSSCSRSDPPSKPVSFPATPEPEERDPGGGGDGSH